MVFWRYQRLRQVHLKLNVVGFGLFELYSGSVIDPKSIFRQLSGNELSSGCWVLFKLHEIDRTSQRVGWSLLRPAR